MSDQASESPPKPAKAAKAKAKTDAPKRSLGRRLVMFGIKLVVITIGAAAVAPVATMVLHGLFAQPQRADVILVPGAALWNGGRDLSDALRYRMNTAIGLWREGYAPKLVLSGGGEGAWDEAAAMARYAEARGVPASAIVLDRSGVTTRATAENLASVLRDQYELPIGGAAGDTAAVRSAASNAPMAVSISADAPKSPHVPKKEDEVIRAAREMLRAYEPKGARVLVVSQWCHVPRVRMALQQAGFRAFGKSCEHPRFLQNEHWMTAREAVGLWAYAFRAEEGEWRRWVGAD